MYSAADIRIPLTVSASPEMARRMGCEVHPKWSTVQSNYELPKCPSRNRNRTKNKNRLFKSFAKEKRTRNILYGDVKTTTVMCNQHNYDLVFDRRKWK